MMKQAWRIIAGLMTGLAIGWALGYLRLPHISTEQAFWVGVALGGLGASGLFLLLTLWRREPQWRGNISFRWLGPTLVFGVAGVTLLLWILLEGHSQHNADRAMEVQAERRQAALIAGKQQNQLAEGIELLIADMQEELKISRNRKLRPETIDRIVRLSQAFSPYRVWEADTLSSEKLSPQRGILLQALLTMGVDSLDFRAIKSQGSFAAADLHQAILPKADLSHADLRGARFTDAQVEGASFIGADVRGADFQRANLNETLWTSANLRRVNYQFAELMGAVFDSANLDGAYISHANLTKASMRDASFQWGYMRATLLTQADLRGCDFKKTDLSRSIFDQADLSAANLARTNLAYASIRGAELSRTSLWEKDWLDQLPIQHVQGATELASRYRLTEDTAKQFPSSKFLLIPQPRLDKGSHLQGLEHHKLR